MVETPLCSVCIANYNGETYLKECIQSVLNQETDFTVEVILHDDASTDGSVELVKRLYPNVLLIPSKENVGYCISNNRMVERAAGKYIVLLNNDATLKPDALFTLVDACRHQGDGIYGLPQYDMATGELIDRGSLFDPFLNPIPNTSTQCENVGMIIGACLFLPKSLWQELGGFPTWFGSLAEDMYLCCRARLRNYPVKAIGGSGFEHWVGRSLGGGKVTEKKTLSTTYRRRAKSERNKTFVLLITYPMPALLLAAPLHLLTLCIEGVVLSFIKREWRIWREIYWFSLCEVYAHLGKLFSERRKVQRLKTVTLSGFFSTLYTSST